MDLLKIFGVRRWKPDLEQEKPPRKEWPDHVLTLDNNGFDNFINKYPVSVVDFWAEWCTPCKMIAPRIRKLSREYIGRVAFGKLNIGKNRDIAKRYHIIGIPYLCLFSYGKKVTGITGVRSINVIKNRIEDILMRFDND